MRKNMNIQYSQLGLEYTLEMFEVLYNLGICLLDSGDFDQGSTIMNSANKWLNGEDEKTKHVSNCSPGIITLYDGLIFRPSNRKVSNVEVVDYLGQSSVVAAVDAQVTHSDQFNPFNSINPSIQFNSINQFIQFNLQST